MSKPLLTSRQHPLIKQLVSLQTKKGRKTEALFLIEGRKLVNEALAAEVPITAILADPQQTPDWEGHAAFQPVHGDLLAKVATTDSPPPVVAAARFFERSPKPDAKLILFVDDLQDPGNLGTIFRTAEATGVDLVLLSPDCVDPYNPKVVRGSMGSLFRLPWQQVADTTEALNGYRESGWQLVATTLEASERMDRFAWGDKVLLMVGQEGKGLGPRCREAAAAAVRIPMHAPVESLNVAVATGALLYELWRRQDFRGA